MRSSILLIFEVAHEVFIIIIIIIFVNNIYLFFNFFWRSPSCIDGTTLQWMKKWMKKFAQ
jgi:hypothetical protein